VPAGRERAVAAALGHRGAALLADDPASALALVERARAAGLGSLVVVVAREPRDLDLPVVPLERLLEATEAAVTEEGIGWDPQRGELWFAGETAEAVLLELEARRRELAAEVEQLAARADDAALAVAEAEERARGAAAAFAPVAHLRNVRRADPRRLERLVA